MKFSRVLPVALLTLVFASSTVSAQEETQPEETQPAAETKLRGRLPNYYGLVGLKDTQVQTIYRIQADYAAQIEALEQQIATLKTQRAEKIDSVLTEKQLERLAKVIAESQRRREQREQRRAERAAQKQAEQKPDGASTPEEGAESSTPSEDSDGETSE